MRLRRFSKGIYALTPTSFGMAESSKPFVFSGGCMIGKLKTTEEFIKDAKAVHGDRYNYSSTKYVGSLSKVIITCIEHGDFQQTPSSHLKGNNGCSQCTHEYRVKGQSRTTEEFITEAKIVHGDRYGYTKTNYFHSQRKVTITCKTHGDFQQIPNSHLIGSGCPKCCRQYSPTTNEFIIKSNTLHESRYTYKHVEYTGVHDKVTIECTEHGKFLQTPNNHLHGAGCPKCAKKLQTSTLKDFVISANIVHKFRYDYSKSLYVNRNTKLIIVCEQHGDFQQKPGEHLVGNGCPKCAKTGFNIGKPAQFYVYYTPYFIGYGITRSPKTRHRNHKTTFNKHNIKAALMHTIYFQSGKEALNLENKLKSEISSSPRSYAVEGFKRESVDILDYPKFTAIINQFISKE